MKTLNKSLLYSILLSLSFGVVIAIIASVFINSRIESANRIKNVESIHQSVTPVLKSSLIISDFGEMQRILGLLSNEQRKFGVFLNTGEWILSDYGSQKLFESAINKLQNKSICKEHSIFNSDSYCTDIQDNAILISIENHKSEFFDLIRSNLWIILIALSPMILFGLLGAKVLQASIIKPFFNLHNEIMDIKIDTNSIGSIEKLNTEREFEELSNITSSINNLLSKIETTNLEIQKREKALLLSEITSQVAHDIRSPLTALNMISHSLVDIPEDKRIMIRTSITRINDIANQLLEKGKSLNQRSVQTQKSLTNAETKTHLKISLLSPIIDSILSEKRILYRDKILVEVEADLSEAYGIFARIDSIELKRLISNLINNSVEAFPIGKGRILVSLKANGNRIILTIEDNGKGIPEDICKKLGEMGISHGKENTQSGSGLGIYHAKKSILNIGGTFEIVSRIGVGTKIIITLPQEKAPDWFVDTIKVSENTQLISIDDDVSIHNVWQDRISDIKDVLNLEYITFTSGQEFKTWLQKQNDQSKSSQIYLVDYELLNQKQTGLDLIEELGIANNSILVTSRYEEEIIRSRCEKLKIKLIPKAMACFVPIIEEKIKIKYDGVLMDDDSIIQLAWKISAQSNNKSILIFDNPNDFLKEIESIDPSTKLYVDSNLGEKIKGQDVAKQAYDLGFKEIYLCTGYDKDTFSEMPWIKDIIGKEMPI